ncbi:MAG TPA: ATP synthase subunit I [Pyrinomonadaceae bacterium]|nr:ATP synthase subunit I [Pyrinomonadaceae bacterium]
MSEEFDPIEPPVLTGPEPSNQRILVTMAVLGVAGGIAGMAFGSFRFGFGIWIGAALGFANYFWLKSSLRKIFSAAESGERPRMLAGKYFLRYIVLGLVVAVIYAAGLLPIAAVILGLMTFAFAVVIEGIMRMFTRQTG